MTDQIAATESAQPATQSAPVAEEVVTLPEPLKTEPLPAEAADKVEKPQTVRDALAKAKEAIEAKEAETEKPLKDKPDPKAKEATEKQDEKADISKAEKAEKPVDKDASEDEDPETGKKPVADDKAAPKRFTNDAKVEWEAVPDKVKAETHRAFRELEAGIEKHRPASQRYHEVYREFDDIARESNVDPKATMHGYITVDRMLHSNNPQEKVQAIENVLKAAGVTPQHYVEYVLSQGQQQQGGEQDYSQQPSREVLELREQVQQLTKMVGSVHQNIQSQEMQRHDSVLEEWTKDKPHFEAVRDHVVALVRDEGLLPDDAYVKAVSEAQDKARAFLGESGFKSPSPKASALAADELEDQTLRGSKSIKGAHGAGSTPATRKPGSSIRDSISKALQVVS